MMRKIILGFIIVTGLSCSKAPQPMSKAEISRRADSIITIRVKEQNEQARIDLEYRIKIEVKVKVDSLLNKRAQGSAKDTIKKIAPAMPPLPQGVRVGAR